MKPWSILLKLGAGQYLFLFHTRYFLKFHLFATSPSNKTELCLKPKRLKCENSI